MFLYFSLKLNANERLLYLLFSSTDRWAGRADEAAAFADPNVCWTEEIGFNNVVYLVFEIKVVSQIVSPKLNLVFRSCQPACVCFLRISEVSLCLLILFPYLWLSTLCASFSYVFNFWLSWSFFFVCFSSGRKCRNSATRDVQLSLSLCVSCKCCGPCCAAICSFIQS